jgi:uncharacterized protein involved in outer membrane biogenesis
MKPRSAWGLSLVALAALLALGVLLLHLTDLSPFRGVVADRLSAASGYRVSIDGALGVDLGLVPHIRLEDVTVAGAVDGTRSQIARIGRLELRLDIARLLSGTLLIHELALVDAELSLANDVDGRVNWRPGGEARSGDDSGGWDFVVRNVEFDGLRVSYRGGGSSSQRAAVFDRLALASEDSGSPIEVSVAGQVGAAPIEISGRLGPADEFFRPSRPYPVSLRGRLDGMDLEVRGSIEKPTELLGARLELSASAEGLHALSRVVERALPSIGPIAFSARLARDRGPLGIEDIDLRLGDRARAWLEAKGHVKDLFRAQSVELELEFGTVHPRHLGSLVADDPPDLGPVTGSARVSDHDGRLGVKSFVLQGGREVFQIDVRGKLEDVRALDDIDARASLETRQLALVGDLFGWRLPALGPARLSGHVVGDAEHAEVRELQGRLGETEFSGSLSGSFAPGQRPHLSAQIETPQLHLADLGIMPSGDGASSDPAAASAAEARPEVSSTGPTELFGDDPIPFERLDLLDADLRLRARGVSGRAGVLLEKLEASFGLRDGELRVHAVDLVHQGERVTGEARVAARESPPTLSLQARVEGVPVARLLREFTEESYLSGTLDAEISLESSGRSAREIAAQLSGDVALILREGFVMSREANLMQKDLFRALVSRDWKGGVEEVNCLIAALALDRGRGRVEPLLLDTQRIVVVGAGEIDLRAQQMDIVLTPRPKRPGPLSVATKVHVKGPLASPSVKPAYTTAVTSAGRALLGGVTQPAGLIPGADRLLSTVGAGSGGANACARALQQLEASTATAGASRASPSSP